ncbi:hypothetical protein TPDSL_34660 [Terrisporobacter petrolearius]|uniref:restriction endonuclease subunit S n=1 Tax=Terrisporobacter petrolearius TaxID=1460447 RepID=UPI003365C03E
MKYNESDNLKHIKLGDYIRRSTCNNTNLKYGEEFIVGVSNQGIFTEPKGNVAGVNLKPYKIVTSGAFVYNPSRLDLGSIAYRTDGICIVSHLYQIFYLNEEGEKIINPNYLFMYFRRKEFYREVTFRNFGSQRPEFNLNDMSEIEIELPSIEIQQKYVDIYNAMLANQKAYETGLEDLRLTCEIEIDKIKHTAQKIPTGKLLENVDVRNADGIITTVQGINITKNFMPSVASVAEGSLKNYKVVQKGQFAYSSMQTGRDECIRIALMKEDEPIIVSPAYSVLQVKNDDVLAEYIMMWFSRSESDRYGWFASDGSIRANLDLDRFYEIDVPVPDIKVQEAIVEIYNAYLMRRDINEKLKSQIKDLCPILIKGALEEANT